MSDTDTEHDESFESFADPVEPGYAEGGEYFERDRGHIHPIHMHPWGKDSVYHDVDLPGPRPAREAAYDEDGNEPKAESAFGAAEPDLDAVVGIDHSHADEAKLRKARADAVAKAQEQTGVPYDHEYTKEELHELGPDAPRDGGLTSTQKEATEVNGKPERSEPEKFEVTGDGFELKSKPQDDAE